MISQRAVELGAHLKMLKYVALIKVEQTIYDHYGVNRYEFGAPGEQPTLLVIGGQVQDYPLPHSVEVRPIYQVDERISKKVLPFQLEVGRHQVKIDSVLRQGGEAIIFNGSLNGQDLVYKMHVRAPRKLRLLPPELRKYLPRQELIFQDVDRVYLVAMERLKEFVWSDLAQEQCLKFLQQLEKLGEVHGDISPGNLMMDRQGQIKLIDFSRGNNLGTHFYSSMTTDRQAMARVLLRYKHSNSLSAMRRKYSSDGQLFDHLQELWPEDEELIQLAR